MGESKAETMHPTKYGPKSNASPTIGDACPLCGVAFVAGDFTALVRTSIKGKFADDAVEAHWDCAIDVPSSVV